MYEHLHRYLWAAQIVSGRRVLDLASGEGFGSATLATTAESVLGVDLDERSVDHASLGYDAANLSFMVGDARALSTLDDDSFDAVVAFEMIEHVGEQELVLAEIERVLEPGGLLIISTPDREQYSTGTLDNPYHVRELGAMEFHELLRSRFANVATFGQRTITGSSLTALSEHARGGASEGRTFFVERAGDGWELAPSIAPLYIVGLASNADLPEVSPDSTLGDPGIELVRRAESAASQRAAVATRAELELARRTLSERATELEQQQQLATALQARATALQARAAHDAHTIASLDLALNEANRRHRRVEGSVTWQFFQRVRGSLFTALGGEDSRPVAVLQSCLRFIGRTLRLTGATVRPPDRLHSVASSERPGTGPIVFPEHDRPEVSIVIPLHAHAELTRAALESIRDHTAYLRYEVILIDDSEDRRTKALLRQVRGAQILVNDKNLGYLRSVERGAAAAQGRWLVLCNNDIEVRPGWLGAMLDCAESRSDVAIVAPKFIYPDGRLAEAGAIIWRDGTGANYGRGDDPTSCHYEYRREIDYGSAAALMVGADFWRAVGGFDERFLPMYYEDTDLCFAARARGLRVLYEPRAEVIHVEGATAGVDETAGHKRHQERNRPKFVEKWGERLERDHLPNDRAHLWKAANMRRQPNVLVIDHRVPAWDRDSGSLRMRGIIQSLLDLGCHVVFWPDNMAPVQPYTRELQRLGVEVLYGVDLREEMERIGPSLALAILSRPQTAGRWLDLVREQAPDAAVVYDTVDLHWLREARQAALRAGTEEILLSPKAVAMRELELALIRATDATVVVTESEREKVQEDVPGAAVHVLPNVNQIRESVPSVERRGGILFVGGFEHTPNVDGALVLALEVMPLVWREVPDVKVTIVGADPPPEVQALASPLVDVAGWVQDLDPLLNSARALVAPLHYGAGLKGKVTQALADGLPVVTTPIGAEGLDASDGEDMLIGLTVAELAERTVRVLSDDVLWEQLSRLGQQLVADTCSPAVMADRLAALIRRSAAAKQAAEPVSVHVR